MSADILAKLKELKNVASETQYQLENSGVSITNIQKEQLFNHNVKNIINAIEGLLRNEPSERHYLRLQKEFPDSYNNIRKLKETPQGKITPNLDKIKDIISFFEGKYRGI
ncbi:MAG TPA: hypothetical protein HA226_04720 [Nanoarchaeota archaeon]|nr:MAG: hypothetical protein QT09_C0009G0036 [archaeon GW2011_AR18]HIH26045.1 hypothetical protein [Nanoarchaeota archaeon]